MFATVFAPESEINLAAAAPLERRETERDALAERLLAGKSLTFAAREHVFLEGDPVADVYRVEAGHVCIYKTLVDGRRQVIDFAYPGDLIGLGAMGKHSANAQALSRVVLRAVPMGALQRLAREDARLGLKLYEAVSRELMAARELLVTVSQRTAMERLASFLMALSLRNDRNGEAADEIVLPMTRSDIADFLGLTIETVSRLFSRLRVAGVIAIEQSILVTIIDREALEGLAGGSDGMPARRGGARTPHASTSAAST